LKIDEIQKLIELVSSNDIDSLELKTGGVEIRISKSRGTAGYPVLQAPATEAAAAPPATSPRPAAEKEPEAADVASEEADEEDLNIIYSSMVGTLYRAPAPGADPFVEIGDTVRKGQIICIIEAMKIMNEIESDATGRLARVYVEDGQPVEYGEKLFAVTTD
jgi:acetyl-CoA carboxylase biotin carboxyl carrier protein